MKNLTLENIAKACEGELHNYSDEYSSKEASCVEVDSRKVLEGGIFIATKGERVDGHSFINQVFEKGALGVICEKEPLDCNKPYILVKDSFEALKAVAGFYRQQLNIPVIGITGSVGKTSTKEFIAGTLGTKFKVCKTQGNFNNEVGMPLTILSIREDDKIAVVEMGISDFGEMSRLASISKPDTCVITNIGQCHLEKLGDRDGVLKAKTEMFKYMNPEGTVFLNGDDDKLLTVNSPNGKDIIYYGMGATNDIRAINVINKGLFGSDATIVMGKGQQEISFDVHIPLPGRHMVFNSLVAAGVAIEYGLSIDEIKKGIESIAPTGGRSNVIKKDPYVVIDDCYNANPVSMKAAIDLLNMANTRKVAILGDMFELGEDECELHKEVGSYAMSHGVDVLIAIGSLSQNMYQGAFECVLSADKPVYCFDTKEEAMEKFPSILESGDSILIKASHGMHFEEIVSYFNK